MNEKNENVGEKKMLDEINAAQASVRLPSRRRLIKLGVAGVPVVATLASSPALAWNCKNPSAWGSNVVASQKANTSNVARDYETWYIANWKGNNNNGTRLAKPWDTLKSTYGTLNSFTYTSITLAQLKSVGAIAQYPNGTTGASKAVDVLTAGGFAASILTAMLNEKVGPYIAVIQGCTSNSSRVSQLGAMAKLQYAPPGGGSNWNEATIIKYLYENWIAR